jgi:hypothetical protein
MMIDKINKVLMNIMMFNLVSACGLLLALFVGALMVLAFKMALKAFGM